MFKPCGSKLLLASLAALIYVSAAGCATPQQAYFERHEIKSLTVVFLDEKSLQEKYAALSGRPALTLSANSSSLSLTTVRGFFDFTTNTIYCGKMDFEVCGHELHHATLGRFHPDHH